MPVKKNQLQIDKVPTEAQGDVTQADGREWLTTSQAYRIAQSRGCDRSAAGFNSWSKRSTSECERLYGLRRLFHGSKSNTVASFQDLRQP
jgi:hypothetical protein